MKNVRWTLTADALLIQSMGGTDAFRRTLEKRVRVYMLNLAGMRTHMVWTAREGWCLEDAASKTGRTMAQVESRITSLAVYELGLSVGDDARLKRRAVLREYAKRGLRTLAEINAADRGTSEPVQIEMPVSPIDELRRLAEAHRVAIAVANAARDAWQAARAIADEAALKSRSADGELLRIKHEMDAAFLRLMGD